MGEMTMDPEMAELHRRAREFVTLERYAELLAHVVHFGNDRLPLVEAALMR